MPAKSKPEINAIRAALMSRGLTIRRWAKIRGYSPVTVHFAMTGKRRGPLSSRIRKELEETVHVRR